MVKENILILDNIRSAINVGAIFRTADAAGISKIFLIGYTPAPLDKFQRVNSQLAKSALGAEKTMAWEVKKSLPLLIKELKKEKFYIIAIEQSKNSKDYKKVSARGGPAFGWKKLAFILGNEVSGISKSVLNTCDIVAEIPMKGEKESLNVSVAAGVAIFRILNL